jgi:hypothetical protein
MSVVLNDVIRIAARLKDQDNQDVVNVWHVQSAGVALVSDAIAMAELGTYLELIYDEVRPHIHAAADFYDLNFFNVTTDHPMGSTPWPTLTVGAGTGDPLPSQVSAMIRGTTGLSRNWARKFFGPYSETANTDNGLIVSTVQAEIVAAGVAWLAGHTGAVGDWLPVVWSSKDSAWHVIFGVIVRDIWSTIRRRRKGRGS